MGQTSIQWIQGQQFIGTDSTKHSVVISSPDEGIGMKPSELLLSALGSCTAYDVVNILTKKRISLTHLDIQLTSEQESDPPWTFRKIHMIYTAGGEGLKLEDLEKAVKLSKEKYCSVSNTLQATVDITYECRLLEAALAH